MNKRKFRGFISDEHGVAAIEFALYAILLTGLFLSLADLGLFYVRSLRINAAVEQSALTAFQNRPSINIADLERAVTNSIDLDGDTEVLFTCNGEETCTNTNRTCSCLSPADGAYTPSPACGTICPASMSSGYYLTVTVHHTHRPLIIPRSWIGNMKLQESATVRLE